MSTRNERQQLQKSYMRYHSELDRVLSGTFTDLPLPFTRLIDAIDCEPPLHAYIESCQELLPDTYDVEALVDEANERDMRVLSPLSDDPDRATAEAYLIVNELAQRRVKFHSPVFRGYDDGTGSLAVRFAGFKTEVFMPLVEHVTAHLDQLIEELGPEQEEEEACSLDEELAALMDVVSALPEDQRTYAQLQAEALVSELAQEEPNDRLVDVLVRSLELIGGANADLAESVARVQAHLA